MHGNPNLINSFTNEFSIYRMGLFSFLDKKKQESTSGKPEFNSRSVENSRAASNRSTRSKPDGADKSSSDTTLPEKKRARRRLTGAIALVLAAIIGLPMLFDSEQKTASSDIAIQIPSVDTPAPDAPDSQSLPIPPAVAGASSSGSVSASTGLGQQEEIIELAPAPAEVQAPAEALAPAEVQAPTEIPAIAPAAVAGSAVAQPAPVADSALHKPVPEARPVSKPELKPEPKPKPEISPTKKADDAARARAILEGRSVTVATEKVSSKFTLQIAALTSQESVDELQGKLKKAGIKSYAQKVATKSGSPIRVRVGPFASKEEAEKMHAKLVRLGFGGTVMPLN